MTSRPDNQRGVALVYVLIASVVLCLMVSMLTRLSLGKFVTYNNQKTDFRAKQLLASVHWMVEACLADQTCGAGMDTTACSPAFSAWTAGGTSCSATAAVSAEGNTYNFNIQGSGVDGTMNITCTNCL